MLATVAAADSTSIVSKEYSIFIYSEWNHTLYTLYINRRVQCVFYSNSTVLKYHTVSLVPILYHTVSLVPILYHAVWFLEVSSPTQEPMIKHQRSMYTNIEDNH